MASRIRYARLATERVNPRSRALDLLRPRQIAALMNREDRRAVLAVARVRSDIAAAVNMIVAALKRGGRLFFVGAGTSGRLGVIEAAECPPAGAAPSSARAKAPRMTRSQLDAPCAPACGRATSSSASRPAA
jgi:N-acetylmuramic acid 6-phosphate (MurNAc-6-P) etherase